MIKGVNLFIPVSLIVALILGLRVHSAVAILLASIGLIGFVTTEVVRRSKLGRSTTMKI